MRDVLPSKFFSDVQYDASEALEYFLGTLIDETKESVTSVVMSITRSCSAHDGASGRLSFVNERVTMLDIPCCFRVTDRSVRSHPRQTISARPAIHDSWANPLTELSLSWLMQQHFAHHHVPVANYCPSEHFEAVIQGNVCV